MGASLTAASPSILVKQGWQINPCNGGNHFERPGLVQSAPRTDLLLQEGNPRAV